MSTSSIILRVEETYVKAFKAIDFDKAAYQG